MKRNLLLLSNSTLPGQDHLSFAKPYIERFLPKECNPILFVPYAAVGFSYDLYTDKVNQALSSIGHRVQGLHEFDNPKSAVRSASTIMIGGGNTFQLLNQLYKNDLVDSVRSKVFGGTPYVGWSAGSNVTCPSIKTTNDMPIVEPPSFEALKLIPFQINPHYTEERLPNHGGEGRKDRIMEFITLNSESSVLCLPEGCLLQIVDDQIELFGNRECKVLKHNTPEKILREGDRLEFLFQ